MVLGEVPGVGLVAPLHGAGVGLQFPHDDLEEGRLADAVGAHDRQPVAALHRQVHPVKDLVVAESLLHPFTVSPWRPLPRRCSSLKVG